MLYQLLGFQGLVSRSCVASEMYARDNRSGLASSRDAAEKCGR